MTNNNYSECVDRLVSTMPTQSSPTNSQQSMKDSAPFDSPAYANYKAQVDKQREHISEVGITNALYELGYKVDTLLAKLIELCDNIEKDNYPDNGIIEEEDSPPKS